MNAVQLAAALTAMAGGQGLQLPAAAAAHIQGLVGQGAKAAPLLETAFAQMAGAQGLQLPPPAGGFVQPPGGGVQQAHPAGDGQPPQP